MWIAPAQNITFVLWCTSKSNVSINQSTRLTLPPCAAKCNRETLFCTHDHNSTWHTSAMTHCIYVDICINKRSNLPAITDCLTKLHWLLSSNLAWHGIDKLAMNVRWITVQIGIIVRRYNYKSDRDAFQSKYKRIDTWSTNQSISQMDIYVHVRHICRTVFLHMREFCHNITHGSPTE